MVMMLKELIEIPIFYDIIVSDFGRDATIEFLKQVSLKEKQIINRILNGLDFFDEYRRIMFTVIGDVAFFKEKEITAIIKKNKCISSEILIGVGSVTQISEEFINRVTLAVLQEVCAAINRGHNQLRIMIPCNTLSELVHLIGQSFQSKIVLRRMAKLVGLKELDIQKINKVNISIHTVAESVMRYFEQEPKQENNVLVLGTRGTNEIYKKFSTNLKNVEVLSLDEWEQTLIDNTIIASIGGAPEDVKKYINLLQEKIIQPRKDYYNNLFILEACTDFQLGIGKSSLEMFADVIVKDCYYRELKIKRKENYAYGNT